MKRVEREPVVAVGLMTGTENVVFELKGAFVNASGEQLTGGSFRAEPTNSGVEIVSENGWRGHSASEYRLAPSESSATFIIRDVTIGIEFHWQQKQDQQFQGAL